jgi:CRP/FNR family transcriptional regulator
MSDILARGAFSRLPQETTAVLLSGARQLAYTVGADIAYPDRPVAPGVVLEGVVRVLVAGTSGREATLRYLRPGNLVGVALMISGARMAIRAVTDATVLHFERSTFEQQLRSVPELTMAVTEEVGAALADSVEALHSMAFASVRQRLVRQLLLRAERGPQAHPVVRATHQELADSVGSVREVVARSLRSMKRDGLVGQTSAGIVLLDVSGLETELDRA